MNRTRLAAARVRDAIDALRQAGRTISLRAITAMDRARNPDRPALAETTVLRNPEAYALYLSHRPVRPPSRRAAAARRDKALWRQTKRSLIALIRRLDADIDQLHRCLVANGAAPAENGATAAAAAVPRGCPPPLRAAATRRRAETVARVADAIAALDAAGQDISLRRLTASDHALRPSAPRLAEATIRRNPEAWALYARACPEHRQLRPGPAAADAAFWQSRKRDLIAQVRARQACVRDLQHQLDAVLFGKRDPAEIGAAAALGRCSRPSRGEQQPRKQRQDLIDFGA